MFAYGRYQDGAAAPYSALGEALGSIVRSMEATGTAERDRWRADLVSEMSALTGILEALVPDLARSAGRGPAGRLTSMRRMLDADCSALSSACCPLPRPTERWSWQSMTCSGLTGIHYCCYPNC